MRVVELTARGAVQLGRRDIPRAEPHSALVAVSRVGLCGSDLELVEGGSPYLLDGRARYPLVPGHEWVGRVVALDGSTRFVPGQRVVGRTMLVCHECEACASGRENECSNLREVGLYDQDGAAAEFIRVPISSLVPVPDGVNDRQAALVEPAVTVLEALTKVPVRPGAKVAVIGPGTLGLLAVKLLLRYPVELVVFGVDPDSLAACRRLGAVRAERFDPQRDSASYDLVFEASGTPAGFEDAQRALKVGAALVGIGVPHGHLDRFDAGRFVLAGHSYFGVRHGMRHYRTALRLFQMGILDESEVLSSAFPLSQAAQAFALLADETRGAPKVSLIPAGRDGAEDDDQN
jgi:threonine dehydrogenase-like Zn-dependent dehydrogenase